jgi:hypothetical protein
MQLAWGFSDQKVQQGSLHEVALTIQSVAAVAAKVAGRGTVQGAG